MHRNYVHARYLYRHQLTVRCGPTTILRVIRPVEVDAA